MRDINLLPGEYKRKLPNRYLFPFMLVLCLSIWPAVQYGFLVPAETREKKAQHLAFLKEETGKLPDLDENIKEQKAGLEELQNRMLAFQEMEEGSPQHWQDILCTLTGSLPAGTSIQDFTCDNASILLSGISSSDVSSAQYMRNLQDSGFFTEVRMEKILYQNNGEINFFMACSLKLIEEQLSAGTDMNADTDIETTVERTTETEEAMP
jgi:Tfp pilus assembly protein PilN